MVSRHAWTNDAKGQVKLAKKGGCEFSHPAGIPIELSVRRLGFCRRKVIARTLKPIWYRDAVGQVSVPQNFTCDLASIPNGLWFFISPFEIAYEAIFHDQNYRSQKITRRYADFQFFYLMEQRGQPWYVRYPVWLAVRLLGGPAWEKHKKRKAREVKK